jgi:hypothetical protein
MQHPRDEERDEEVAVHEAGHSGMLYLLGRTIRLASIKRHADSDGRTLYQGGRNPACLTCAEHGLLVAVAGAAAETLVFDVCDWGGSITDVAEVQLSAERLGLAAGWHEQDHDKALELLEPYKGIIMDLAAELLDKTILRRRQIEALLAGVAPLDVDHEFRGVANA